MGRGRNRVRLREVFGSNKPAGGAPFYGSRVGRGLGSSASKSHVFDESFQDFIYVMSTLVYLCILSLFA